MHDQLYLDFQAAIAGQYALLREIGRGGMGVVFLAHELHLDRPVALKLLPAELAADTGLRARFIREARTAARLSHPHIIPVYSAQEAGEFVFFAMPFVRGTTLAELVAERGRIPGPEAIRILREIAWALAHAHSSGIVHRDIKAENVIVEEASGRCLVADFGIAKAGGSGGTGVGEIVGTPSYMSPEQICGDPVDGRADIYSLGVLAHLLLSGSLPFSGASSAHIIQQHLTVPAPLLDASALGISPDLAAFVRQCMAKSPDERPADAASVAHALGGLLPAYQAVPGALRIASRHAMSLVAVAHSVPLLAAWTIGIWLVWAQVSPWTLTALAGGLLLLALMATFIAQALVHAVEAEGHSLDDLVRAIRRSADDANEERSISIRRSQTAPPLRPMIELGGVVALFVALVLLAMGGRNFFADIEVVALLVGGSWIASAFVFGGIRTLQLKSPSVSLAGQLRYTAWFLDHLLVRRFLNWVRPTKLLEAATQRPRLTVVRPTELVIVSECQSLLQSIPASERKRLPLMSAVINDLAARAGSLRRQAELGDPVAGARLQQTMLMLDQLRLDLLRAVAGRPFTQSFDALLRNATSLSDELARIEAARAEVARLLR